jgi:hypothetical protein
MSLIPEKLDDYDFPDTKWESDGYGMTQTPTASDRNFMLLVERYNQLIDYLNPQPQDKEK